MTTSNDDARPSLGDRLKGVLHGERTGVRDDGLVLSEEQLRTGVSREETGRIRVVKHVDTDTFSQQVPREVQHADLEREPVREGDSGQVETLPDGSLSVPVFEEQLFVEKRLVVRERVIVRKRTVVEQQEVTAQLRSERVEITTEGDVRLTDDSAPLA